MVLLFLNYVNINTVKIGRHKVTQVPKNTISQKKKSAKKILKALNRYVFLIRSVFLYIEEVRSMSWS